MIRFAVAVAVGLVMVATIADAADLDPGFVEPSPTPLVVPPGLYLVTEVYAGSVATTSGATTTYQTITVRATPGTYARLLGVVATGIASPFDGRSFNGRARLGDGRAVAGAYYETFVLTAMGFVAVNIVFFQDDSETRALIVPTSVPASAAPTVAPVRTTAPSATVAPAPVPSRLPAPTMPPLPVAAAGIALAPTGPTLTSIEVLRGRVVQLWPRAFVDGLSVPVRSWRLVSGGSGAVSPAVGSGMEPAGALWLVPVSTPEHLLFEVTSDAAPGRAIAARLAVTVRSPALLQ